jgi:PAS domain S-box-containing protein
MNKDFSASYKELNSTIVNLLDSFSALSALSSLDLRNVDEPTMLRNALKGLVQNIDVENCSIFLLKNEALVNCTGLDWDDLLREEKTGTIERSPDPTLIASIGEGIMGLAVQRKSLQHCRNCFSDKRFKSVPGMKIGSLISVPIFRMGGEVLGVLNISHPEPDFFDLWHERFLVVYCHCLGQLLSNYRLLNNMELEIAKRTIQLRQALDETRAAEQGLRMFKTIIDSLQEAVVIRDPVGSLVYVNPAYEKLFGRSQRDAGFSDIFDNYVQDSARIVEEKVLPRILRRESWEGELEAIDAEGRRFPLWQLSGAVHSASGALLFIFSFMRDNSRHKEAQEEKKKLEQQLHHSQKMESIGQLAGGIAHDFNNIITAITGYAHLLFMKMHEDDPMRQFTGQIIASSERAANLTQGLLAFSRKQVIHPKPVNVNVLILKVEKLLRRLIREDIKLTIELSTHELFVLADAGQMEQILINLSTNARDAMPDGGALKVSTELKVIDDEFIKDHGFGSPGKYACITASDTGIGIDDKIREKIFDPFFTTKEVGKGTGLGLAIVYGVVSQQNGYIDVCSGPERGTSLRIYLPLISGKEEEARVEASRLPSFGTETVLIAEDDEAVRTFDTNLLSRFGYNVLAASDGDEALEKFMSRKDDIDIVVLDVVMPGKNGKEVHDRIQKIRPGTRVLFTSGYSSEIVKSKGLVEGDYDFIEKPHTPLKLLSKLREMMDYGERRL